MNITANWYGQLSGKMKAGGSQGKCVLKCIMAKWYKSLSGNMILKHIKGYEADVFQDEIVLKYTRAKWYKMVQMPVRVKQH